VKRRQVYVFGANREGRHGKGAALECRLKHGAIYGQAEGRQGDSYGIITKELRRDQPKVTLEEVRLGVEKFIRYADAHRHIDFIVMGIGTVLAGFKTEQIAPMFARIPINIQIPDSFKEALAEAGEPWRVVRTGGHGWWSLDSIQRKQA
jgi:hypothetical protein